MPVNINDKFEIFGTGNVYQITGKNESGYWIISVKRDVDSDESLDGVLISPETLQDGIDDGKLIRL